MMKLRTNTTSFKKGRKKTGGRKAGARNHLTRELTDAVLEAMDQVGYDGHGLGSRTGYLRRLAERHPGAFAPLVCRLLPMKLAAGVDVTIQNRDEILKQLRLRNIPVRNIFDQAPIPMLDLQAEEVRDKDINK